MNSPLVSLHFFLKDLDETYHRNRPFKKSCCLLVFVMFLGILSHVKKILFADTEQIRETLRRGLEINSKPVLPPINAQRQNGLNHDRAP